MSPEEEEIFSKLRLFESTLEHAWVVWDGPDSIQVRKSTFEEVLAPGKYELSALLSASDREKLTTHYRSISDTVSNIDFLIKDRKGKDIKLSCVSVGAGNLAYSLWYLRNDKDDSVFYLQNAAHDFRSPLSSILGVVNLLHHSLNEEENLSREELVTMLDMIKVNANKTLRLADEIMELAEIESENYKMEMEPVVMKEFVQKYLDTHRLLTLKKKIEVQFHVETDAQAMINESKLTRALDNILSNAVKFSQPSSTIDFLLTEDTEWIVVSIKDHGVGMSEEILSNLFVKFGRSKRTGLDGEPSHGLGMSIVKQIMELHNGDIAVESKEGEGTTVRLMLKKIA